MNILINTFIVIIAALHIWFLILEMFLWQKPIGRKTFRLSEDFAKASARLAANQGLYNGFLSAGLIWSVFANETQLKIFFLSCVTAAGIYGAISVSQKIFFVQALPAMIALGLVLTFPA